MNLFQDSDIVRFLKNKIKKELELKFSLEEDYIGNNYSELSFLNKNLNYRLRFEFVYYQDKPLIISVYKRNNNSNFKVIKHLRFDFEQEKEILEAILSIKRELELKEIFTK